MDKEKLNKMTAAIEAAINPIVQKGASMNAAEIDIVSKAASAFKNLKKIEYMDKQIDYMDKYDGYSSRRFYGGGEYHKNRMIDKLEKMCDDVRQTTNDCIRRIESDN